MTCVCRLEMLAIFEGLNCTQVFKLLPLQVEFDSSMVIIDCSNGKEINILELEDLESKIQVSIDKR